MQHSPRIPRAIARKAAALSLVPLVLFLGACKKSRRHSQPPKTPVYVESEINDTEFEANYFGTLRPGDHFFIDGHITDIPFDPFDPFNGYDPYDGFAFTAGQPVHVEFWLYAAGRPDLDLCVYDPQIGLDIACYQTASNPEAGAIDVFTGNYDFHLVVESYIGSGSYSLEIAVSALYPDAASEEAGSIRRADSVGLASAAAPLRDATPLDGYRRQVAPAVEADEPVLMRRYYWIETDATTGEVQETEVDLYENGTWMGKHRREQD